MPKALPDKRLIRLAEATNVEINYWKEGVSLQKDSGRTIRELISKAAADRWHFAYEHRHDANKLLNSKPPLYRSAVSRYYYSMYHAMRACVFVSHQGDDHEQHSELPKYKLSFPSDLNWQNILKDARELRNRADYEPYPKSNKAWRLHALRLKKNADLLLSTTRTYLQNKGCIL